MKGAQHVAIEGVRLAVRRDGPASAPAGRRVLLLHGAGHTSAIWAPLVDQLTSDRVALALDRRGYGDSESTSAPAAQEARNYAALLVRESDAADQDGSAPDQEGEAADEERADPTDVVAEGDGIDVALALCALRPDLVGRLVLIEGPRHRDGLTRWPRRKTSPTVDAAAPDRALLIASAPRGAVPAQSLMKALVQRAEEPATIRMVTIPSATGDPMTAAPAAVSTIVAAFLREQ